MKIVKFIWGVVLLTVLSSCNKDNQELTRSFHLGFTPMPEAASQEAVNFTYEKISRQAEIINHHFDNGVPWVEALRDEPFHENIINDWTFRKNATQPDEKIYVSVAALNPFRDGLARYRSEAENMELPAEWSSYRFNDEAVKTAYLNYCKRIIAFFNPDCFNMNIEANALHFADNSQWMEFMEFHQFVYTELKNAYPDLVIFSSVTGAYMLDGYFKDNDHFLQRLAVLQVLEHSDLYALSLYPYFTDNNGNPYSAEALSQLFHISQKPLAIAAGAPFTLQAGREAHLEDIPQITFMESLLNACSKRKARFVINFVFHDDTQLRHAMNTRNMLVLPWWNVSQFDDNALQRTPYTTWKHYLGRKIIQD